MAGSRACLRYFGAYRSGTALELHQFPQSISFIFERNFFSIYLPYAMSKKAGENKKTTETVMVFGTFDGLHPGHLNFFKQARRLAKNSFLVISLARDKNVFRVKGQKPVWSERKRLAILRQSGLADRVVLGGLRDHIPHIAKVRPDIIALGYDQKAYVKNLKKDLVEKNIEARIVRLKPYKQNIYKNRLLKQRA